MNPIGSLKVPVWVNERGVAVRCISIPDSGDTEVFIVTFANWDGSILKEEVVVKGSDATPPSNPSRDNYVFRGWDKSYLHVTEDLYITAVFSDRCLVTEDHEVDFVMDDNVTFLDYTEI